MAKPTGRKKLALLFLAILLAIPIFNVFIKGIVVGIGNSVWDGKHHITIVIDNGDISLWSIEPVTKQATEVIIAANTYLTVPNYGSYRASALGRLSMLEYRDGSLVKAAIEESLGVPVDGIIMQKADAGGLLDLREFFGVWGIISLFQQSVGGSQWVTNLSFFDIARLWVLTGSVTKESIEVVYISDMDASTRTFLPDGLEGLTIDKDRFSNYAPTYFADATFVSENLTIEILNGTTSPGKANSFAAILGNSGANVINTGTSENVEQTLIKSAKRSYTAEKIAALARSKLVIEEQSGGRADILVILGGE